MENTGFKGLLVTLYQRIILSYKTTLIGILIVAGGVIVESYVNSPNKLIAGIAAVAGSVLVFVKERYPAPPAQLPPAAG